MTRTLTVGPRFLPADRSESPSLRYIDVSWPSTALSVMLSLPAMAALERPSAIHWRSSRCMGLIKTTGLVGSTLAAYNLDRIRSFKAKHGLDNDAQVVERSKQHRARRRSGTWGDIVESGPAPPPT